VFQSRTQAAARQMPEVVWRRSMRTWTSSTTPTTATTSPEVTWTTMTSADRRWTAKLTVAVWEATVLEKPVVIRRAVWAVAASQGGSGPRSRTNNSWRWRINSDKPDICQSANDLTSPSPSTSPKHRYACLPPSSPLIHNVHHDNIYIQLYSPNIMAAH